MSFTPQDIVTVGGGVIALFIVLLLFYTRSSKDGSLDDRVMRQLDDRDETIKSLNDRNRELNDRMALMTEKLIDLSTSHGGKLMDAIADARKESHDAVVRLHGVVEETKRDLLICKSQHSECDSRLGALERHLALGGLVAAQVVAAVNNSPTQPGT